MTPKLPRNWAAAQQEQISQRELMKKLIDTL
jgi:hypothetical protein